jgi:hypothetical protein
VSHYYHQTVLVVGYGKHVEDAHELACKHFPADRVTPVMRPREAEDYGHGHRSFMIAPSGRKGDTHNDLRVFCAALRKDHHVDYVRLMFGEDSGLAKAYDDSNVYWGYRCDEQTFGDDGYPEGVACGTIVTDTSHCSDCGTNDPKTHRVEEE